MKRLYYIIVCVCLFCYIALTPCYASKDQASQQVITSQAYRITETKVAMTPVKLSLVDLTLSADSGSLLHDVDFVLETLDKSATPLLDASLIAVQGESYAYRLLPHGEHFRQESPARIELAYNVQKIPYGFEPQDIYTYYFDEVSQQWSQLRRLSVDTIRRVVISETTHFTDFINAVVRTPDMPEVRASVPAEMDIPEPHPLQNVNAIAQPQVNNLGSAEITYPITLPAGRNNLQPDLSLSYSSLSGNGILGYGWQLPMSAITMDTRWGVPRYDATYETEIYCHDGVQLVMKDGNPDLKQSYQSNTRLSRRTGAVRFIVRDPKNGNKIIRHGDKPSNYWWEVIDRQGTTHYYGKYATDNGVNSKCVLKDDKGNIGYWALAEVVDLYGNFVRYEYAVSNHNEIYPQNIYYTGHRAQDGTMDMEPVYRIFFHYMQRDDVIKDGRLGFIRQTDSLMCYLDVSYTDNNGYYQHYQTPDEHVALLILNHRFIFHYTESSSVSLLAEIHDLYNYHDGPWSTEDECYAYLYNSSGESVNGVTSFDYYTPSLDNIFSPVQTLSSSPDALGKTESSSWQVGGTLSLGFGPDVWNSNFSVGGNYTYHEARGQTLKALLDMNGDGLSDLVYIKNSNIYFRPQLNSGGFGSEVNTGLPAKNLSNEISQTHAWGLQAGLEAYVLNANVSGGMSYTDSYTNSYFADVNGDGLPDYVNEGEVYFNRLNTHGGFLLYNGESEVILDSTQCVNFHYDGEVEFIPDCVVKDSIVSEYIFHVPDCSLGYHGTDPDTPNPISIDYHNCEECDDLIREYIMYDMCPIDLHSAFANRNNPTSHNRDSSSALDPSYPPQLTIEERVIECLKHCNVELPCPECLDYYHVEGMEEEYEQCKLENHCRTLCNVCAYHLLLGDEQGYLDCINDSCLDLSLYTVSTPCLDCEQTCLDDINNCRECIRNNPTCMVCTECIQECSNNIQDCLECKRQNNCFGGHADMCFDECYDQDADMYNCGMCMVDNGLYCAECLDTCLQFPELCRTCVQNHCYYDETESYLRECWESAWSAYDVWLYQIMHRFHNVKITNDGYHYYAHQIDTICPELTDPEIEAVRVWVAPRDGQVTLYSSLQLLEDTTANRRQARQVDGVRCLIQHNYNVSVNQTAHTLHAQTSQIIDAFNIGKNDYNPKNRTYTGINVKRGDVFFFHLRSVRTHNFDNVIWNQQFVYTNDSTYSSADDFICSSDNKFQADQNGTIVLNTDVACRNNASAKLRILVDGQRIDSFIITPSTIHNRKEFTYPANALVSVEVTSSDNLGYVETKPYLTFTPVQLDASNQAYSQWLAPHVTFTPEVVWDSTYYNLFGPLYRGWGQFGYNNTNAVDVIPLQTLRNTAVEYVLTAPSDSSAFCQSLILDTTQMMHEGGIEEVFHASNNLYDPLDNAWIQMSADASQYRWEAYGRVARNGRHLLSNTRDTKLSISVLAPDSIIAEDEYPDFDNDVPIPSNGISPKVVRKWSKNKQWNINAGLGVAVVGVGSTRSESDYTVMTDYMDMNGDNYPDIIHSNHNKVQYTQPWGGLGQLQSTGGVNPYSNHSVSRGQSVAGNFVSAVKVPGFNMKDGKFVSQTTGSMGTNSTTTTNETVLSYMDINGDGLPDKIVRTGNTVKAYLNIGYRFSSTAIPITNLSLIDRNSSVCSGGSAGLTSGIGWEEIVNVSTSLTSRFQVSLAFGLDVNNSKNAISSRLIDINGDGWLDLVTSTNNGIAIQLMSAQGVVTDTHSVANVHIQRSETVNQSINLGVTGGFSIIFIKICLGINGSVGGKSTTQVTHDLVDVNGDGLPDLVWVDNNGIHVRYNQLGKSRLLKTITNPTGQKMTLNYQLSAPTRERRGRQWLLTELTDVDPYANPQFSCDTIRRTFSYSDPHYDYGERQFLGYGTTVSQDINLDTVPHTPYRKTVCHYNNTDFVEHGKLTYECLSDGDNHQFREYEIGTWYVDSTFTPTNNLCGDASIKIGSEVHYTRYYEGTSDRVVTAKKYEYDKYHNVVRYTNLGDSVDTNDDLRTTIVYDSTQINSHNLISSPVKMTVCNNGVDVRELQADYNDGLLTELRRVDLLNNRTDTTNYHYDAFGLPDTVFYPANHKGERAYTAVIYDTVQHSLPAVVSDQWNRKNHMTYDVMLQSPRSITDAAGNTTWYIYDGLGRVRKMVIPEDTLGHYMKVMYSYSSRNLFRTHTWPYVQTSIEFPYYSNLHLSQYTIKKRVYADYRGAVLYRMQNNYTNYGYQEWTYSTISAVDRFGRLKTTFRNYKLNNDNYSVWDEEDLLLNSDSLHILSQTRYDILDRPVKLCWQDNHSQSYRYSLGDDARGLLRLKKTLIDENGFTRHEYTSPQGWITTSVLPTDNTTSFNYDALGQMLSSTDPDGLTTTYSYDGLGRKTERHHPDAGTTRWTYDNAGNMVSSATQRQIDDGTATLYEYDYNRLSDVRYPQYPQLHIHYEYDSVGHISKRTDITGQESYRYDVSGNVSVSDRLFVLPTDNYGYRFRTEYKYDALGRIQLITYPDEEIVRYRYNTKNIEQISTYSIDDVYWRSCQNVSKFDAYDRPLVITKYGTTTTYTYDANRLWLTRKTTANTHRTLQDLQYNYDATGNITTIVQNADSVSHLGGPYTLSYQYDSLYRLTRADMTSDYLGSCPNYAMTYSPSGLVGSKSFDDLSPSVWHGFCRTNNGTLKNHQVRSIYDTNRDETAFLQWDADGQLQAITNPCSAGLRYHWWNDAGQLASIVDDEHCGFYGYDGDGNRVYKLTGYSLVDSYNAGTERFGLYLGDAMLYVNPYMVVTTRGYTKHYYDGSQRIAAKIGDLADLPNNVVDTSAVALERIANVRAYMTALLNTVDTLMIDTASVFMDIAGNVPDKLQWQCTDDNKWFLNTVVHCDSDILLPVLRKDSAIMAHQASGTYCYHSDHLGSATWITTGAGQPVEYLHYLPYGELWGDQRTTSYSERFRFTGKERDTETGYDYFGARYYSSTLPTWLSVDPLSDKYPNVSPYAYCNWNPVIKVDPNGMDEWTLNYKDGQFQYSSNKGGNKTDYYNVGTYEGEKFISHTSFEIERNEGNINVFRIEETTESTISAFHIPNSTQEFNSGFFLERPGPDSDIAGHNLRIPANTYKLHSNMGKNFPNVPRLYLEQEGINGKFDNRGILIHPGNSPINTRGCLLPGSYKRGDYVGNSKNTLKMIQEYIQSKNWNVTLNIFNSLR